MSGDLKRYGRRLRRESRRTLWVAGALALAAVGCRGSEPKGTGAGERPDPPVVVAGGYAIGERTLYRLEGDGWTPVAVLPRAGAGADTLWGCGGAVPGFGGPRFHRLSLSPDSATAAWATRGPDACVGSVGPGPDGVRVLGRWSAASPDSLIWAPAGRYLAVTLARPGGRHGLAVFDVARSRPLSMPWEAECAYADDCDVETVRWLGGSLLNVGIRLGPAEASVPFEVNVARAAPAAEDEES